MTKRMKIFFIVGRNEDDDSTCFWTIYDQLMCDEVISYYDICQRVMNCIFFLEKKIENTVSKSNQILFLKPISFVGLLSQNDKNVVYHLELYKNFI